MGFSSTSPLPLIDAKAARGLILAAFPRRLRFCLDTALRIPAAREGIVAEITALVPEAAALAAAWNTTAAAAGADPWCDPALVAAREALMRFLDHHAAACDVPAARALADLVVLLSCGGDDTAAAARIALPLWLEAEALPGLVLHLPALAEAQTSLGLGRLAGHDDEEVDVDGRDAEATLLEGWTDALEAAYATANAAASSIVAAAAVLSRGGSAEFLTCTLLVRALISFGERLTQPVADQAGERERWRRRKAEAALAKAVAEHRRTSQALSASPQVSPALAQATSIPTGQVRVVAEVRETGTDRGRSVTKGYEAIIGKPVPLAPVPDLAKVRRELAFEFPYAIELVDRLLVDLVGRRDIAFRPTLLVGPPGTGKSRLASRLADHLAVGLWRVDATRDSCASIGGTDRRWATSEPSHPIMAIARFGIANPIILVDEIDKSATRTDHGRLWDALLPLLETETASRYPDPAFQVEVDLAHVSWIATANAVDPLPGPLRDRLRVLAMPAPQIRHLESLIAPVLAGIAENRGLDRRLLENLDGEEIDVVRRGWQGGSIRRLSRLVEAVVMAREALSLRH